MSNENYKKYPRGSEWIRWDLHLHTPSSFDYENKSITDEEIINEIKKINLSVVAITDHHIIDVKRIKNLQRIAGGEVSVLPGIEFRTDKGGSESVHIIGIFSEDSEIESTWDKIKGKLNLTEADIKKAGGDDCIFVNLETACDLIHECGGIVSIHAGKKTNSIENITNALSHKIAIKKNILEHIDIFEVGSLEDVTDYETVVYPKISKNPPIIICSDNHNVREYKTKAILWIKSIPTFNGLKQILYEKERVYIGEESPTRADLNKTIKSLIIEKSNSWFDKSEIQINPWSVSMIGGKGTGKTAMLDIIALTANKNWKELEENRDSFIKKAKKELHGLSTKLVWCDGSEDVCELDKITSPIIDKSKDFRKVVYLSQGFISQLCSNVNELQRQIEAVIYQNVKNEDRIIYSNFDEYKNSKLNAVKSRQNELRGKLNIANEKVNKNLELIYQKEDNAKNIELKGKEVLRIDKEIKKISTGLKEKKRQELFKEYQKFGNEKSELEKVIAQQREDIRNIDLILEKITSLKVAHNDSIEEINSLFRELGVKSVISIKILPENISKNLNNFKKKRKEVISNKVKELGDINGKINALAQKLELEKSKQDKLSELSELHKKAKEEKASLIEKGKKIANAEMILAENKNEQKILLYSFFVTLFQEKEILEEIYNPLESILEKSEEENKNFFRFSVALGFNYEVMADKGNALIDHRKSGKYLNTSKEQLLIDLRGMKEADFELNFEDGLKNKELSQKNKINADKFLAGIMSLFYQKDDSDVDLKIKNQLSIGYSMKDFYNWVFSTEYYKLSYAIKFNEKDLDSLSPGLKGVALLILYLELDKEDNRPILIDQPEENLDNRFIYNTLVKYFKIAKKRRQVIIATHNANLVVNTDAEQVFVANFDKDKKEQKNYISYVSGAIEDTFNENNGGSILESRGIREHIIDVLEGSEDAFKKRERRYNLS